MYIHTSLVSASTGLPIKLMILIFWFLFCRCFKASCSHKTLRRRIKHKTMHCTCTYSTSKQLQQVTTIETPAKISKGNWTTHNLVVECMYQAYHGYVHHIWYGQAGYQWRGAVAIYTLPPHTWLYNNNRYMYIPIWSLENYQNIGTTDLDISAAYSCLHQGIQ